MPTRVAATSRARRARRTGLLASMVPSLVVGLLLLPAAMKVDTPALAASSTCGNGVVDADEQCDPGSPLGSPGCSPTCRAAVLEPPGLPFGSAPSLAGPRAPRIYSPFLTCAPFAVRDGSRHHARARVRYRIHLCQNAFGVDSFSEQAVRAVMSRATEQFGRAHITLEEESLVRFVDSDCNVLFEDPTWQDALVASTPPDVLSVVFLSNIFSSSSQFGIGGYCYYGGPLCVNAGAYDTLVIHELGHFVGLAHTFTCSTGSETVETCPDTGDLTCDTPPDRGPLGVNGIDICLGNFYLNGSCSGPCDTKLCLDGSMPDGFAWMSYYHCTPGHFTAEQRDFMRCMLEHEMRYYDADAPTTTTTTSTSTTTTSTTLPAEVECGDYSQDGLLTAGDALGVLRTAVGAASCELWRCDYDGSGAVSAADALAILMRSVGGGQPGQCPAIQ